MQQFKLAVLGLALASTVSVAGECVRPDTPTMPDGASSSMEDMLNGQKAVKTFQTANLEYMACLEKEFTAAETAGLEGPEEGKAAAKAAYEKALDAYNAAVSQEEEVAGGFNAAIREYKAANPG